eukprot:4792888-Amphidinium_carterae.1
MLHRHEHVGAGHSLHELMWIPSDDTTAAVIAECDHRDSGATKLVQRICSPGCIAGHGLHNRATGGWQPSQIGRGVPERCPFYTQLHAESLVRDGYVVVRAALSASSCARALKTNAYHAELADQLNPPKSCACACNELDL